MTDEEELAKIAPSAIALMIGEHVLEAARYLRLIQDHSPDAFLNVAEQLNIGRRKAYALAQIDRAFHELEVPRERLHAIGWSKLVMLARYVSADNVEVLLKAAEISSPSILKQLLRGDVVDPEGRVVVMFLRSEELELFDAVIEQYGGIKTQNGGWANKEMALMAALTTLMGGE